MNEQKDITGILREKISHIEEAEAQARREIDLIREYRTRLIADVVTGKLDVRGVEVPGVEKSNERGGRLGEASLPGDAFDEMVIEV